MTAPHTSTCPPIDASAIYLSPLGHSCRWVPLGGARGSWGYLYFEYVGARAKVLGDGFTISHYNVRLLRKVA